MWVLFAWLLAIPAFSLCLHAKAPNVSWLHAAGKVPARAGCKLPPAALKLIAKRFPGMHIVGLKDLVSDDQVIWQHTRPNQCPGLARGKFGPGITGYAVSLVKMLGNARYIAALALVFRWKRKEFKLHVLIPATEMSAHVMVVEVFHAGKYESAERDEVIHIQYDLIDYAALEAADIGFYWKDGKFRRILLTE